MKTLLFILLAAINTLAMEYTLNMDVVSAYVDRGATYNNGGVYQPSLDITNSDLSVGVWVNYDHSGYDGQIEGHKLSEVDVYINYSKSISKLKFTGGYTSFTYPDSDYDTEQELSLIAIYDILLNPTLVAMWGFDGAIYNRLYYQAEISHSLKDFKSSNITYSTELGGTVGYSDPRSGNSGFSHYGLSITETADLKFMSIGIDFYWVGQINDDVLKRSTSGGGYDVPFIVTISMSKSW